LTIGEPHDRAQRAALTEAAFRIANERMHSWEERSDGPEPYLCECAVDGCREYIELTHDDYETVRAHVRHFAVRADHVLQDLEEVVERHEGYVTIEKPAPLTSLLTEADPRQDAQGEFRDRATRLADEIGPP